MKTSDYVKEFKLDKANYNFNREAFMKAFDQEFKERVSATKEACEKMKVAFSYPKFLHLVKEQQDKFWCISNKKVGEPFSEKLFSAFFAICIIPIRAELFPEEHAKIEEKFRKNQELKAEREAKHREEQAKSAEMKELGDALLTYIMFKKESK